MYKHREVKNCGSYQSTHAEVHIEEHIYYHRPTVATVFFFFLPADIKKTESSKCVCLCFMRGQFIPVILPHTHAGFH